ncbi:MAG: sigma-54-dependent Fis family transcriptional regulator [Planctomycetes bacterium]|nr:sigma-54-dependent Fis family transcriptional regulator [Planctomycetota bacterium]
MAETVLIVDDESYVRESLAEILEGEGFEVGQAGSADEALAWVRDRHPHCVVTDLKMPGTSGIEMIQALRDAGVECSVIVVTGAGSVHDAVGAMKAGAFDFLLKPIDPDQLVVQIQRAVAHGLLVDEVGYLRRVSSTHPLGRRLVGDSAAMVRVRESIGSVAPTDVPVLLGGESGTGKEIAAAMIHRESPRRDGPFVTVNCAAIPESLFESECFGHVRGAFSGAHADREGRFAEAEGGTLFLDEIGTLDLEVQAKLLRVLESQEYQVIGDSKIRRADVRVIAATNEDLQALAEEGRFRPDLYFRLSVFPIDLPPLREHPEDIGEITRELARQSRLSREGNEPRFELSPEAIRVLEGYHWPGNVRELANVLERALILLDGDQIGVSDLIMRGSNAPIETEAPKDLRTAVEDFDRNSIRRTLELCDGNRERAAEALGLSQATLYRRLEKLGLKNGN